MTSQSKMYLIVGLGNPGKAYAETRHNIGFRIVDMLAEKYKGSFRRVNSLHGLLAEGVVGEKKVIFLKPETYMNSSGEAVRACLSYYGVPLTQVCVVCDDIYLPLGRLRIKACGSAGGHNGLKSISAHLGTEAYGRLRVGVGERKHGDLADHVLSSFLEEEKQRLPDILRKSSDALECWVVQGIIQAMQHANACQEEKKPEEKLGE